MTALLGRDKARYSTAGKGSFVTLSPSSVWETLTLNHGRAQPTSMSLMMQAETLTLNHGRALPTSMSLMMQAETLTLNHGRALPASMSLMMQAEATPTLTCDSLTFTRVAVAVETVLTTTFERPQRVVAVGVGVASVTMRAALINV